MVSWSEARVKKIVSTMSCSMQTVFHSVIQLLHDKTFTDFKNHENYLTKYFHAYTTL